MINKAVILKNISKRFQVDNTTQSDQVHDGFFYALDDVSLSIEKGECTIIAGANGSGKSLLMSIIAGLDEPTSGTVQVNGKAGLVFQEPDAQILGETPREDIEFGPRNMKMPKEQIKLCVDSALEQTGLKNRADFPARSLSGGEKRRLAAAGVLAMNAEIIIFDEPYSNMDYPGVKQINRLFKDLIKDGKTIIILTHELEKCLSLANRFIILFKGKKVYDADVNNEILNNLENYGIHNPLSKKEELLW